MLNDFDIDKFTGNYLIKFHLKDLKSQNDLKLAIALITCVSLDYDLDPELELEDMREIMDKTLELEKECFTFEIGEEGIEVDI